VIQTRKAGRVRTCRLKPEALGAAAKWLALRQEEFWRAGLEAVDGLLKEENRKRSRKERRR
jgi:hypothetical protein